MRSGYATTVKLFKAICGFNLVSLIPFLHLKPRRFLRTCLAAFDVALQNGKSSLTDIPLISLDEILGDSHPLIRMPVVRYEDGMLPSNEAMTLISILVAEHPIEVLEVGTTWDTPQDSWLKTWKRRSYIVWICRRLFLPGMTSQRISRRMIFISSSAVLLAASTRGILARAVSNSISVTQRRGISRRRDIPSFFHRGIAYVRILQE
jgi:hypothetical protein